MKIITIQPADHIDNVWVTPDGEIVEGKKTPYPFHVKEDGNVDDQDFWRGDPSKVVGFQAYNDRQKVDVWWNEVVADPTLAVGMYPVMVGPTGLYTYMIAVESVEVTEVAA